MNTEYKEKSYEELASLYRENKDEWAFQEIYERTAGLRYTLAEQSLNIPDMEMDDLLSEGAIALMEAINKFRADSGTAFTSFLWSCIRRRYTKLAERGKSGSKIPAWMRQSFDDMQDGSEDFEKSEGQGDIRLSVECDEYNATEIRLLLDAVGLSDRELEVANLLMDGFSKPDIARVLGVKVPAVHTYSNRVAKKIRLAGAYV